MGEPLLCPSCGQPLPADSPQEMIASLQLRPMQTKFLLRLAEKPGEWVSDWQMTQHLWGWRTPVDPSANLKVSIAQMRPILFNAGFVLEYNRTRQARRIVPRQAVVSGDE